MLLIKQRGYVVVLASAFMLHLVFRFVTPEIIIDDYVAIQIGEVVFEEPMIVRETYTKYSFSFLEDFTVYDVIGKANGENRTGKESEGT